MLTRKSLYSMLTVFCVAWFFVFLTRMIVPPLLPLITSDLKLTYTESGLIITSLLIGYGLVSYPAGWLADRTDIKKIILPGLFLLVIATSQTSFSVDLKQLVIFQFLTGLGVGLYITPASTLISILFPVAERGRAYGIHESSVSSASATAPLIALPFAILFGWRQPFLLCAIFLLFASFLFWKFVKQPKHYEKCGEKGTLSSRNIMTSSVVFTTTSFALSSGFSYWAFFGFLPTYLLGVFEIDIVYAGILFLVASISGIVGRVFSGFLADLFGRKFTAIFMAGVASLFIFLFALAMVVDFFLILILLVIGFALNGYVPVLLTLMADVTPVSTRGRGFGLLFSVAICFGSLSGVTVGYFMDTIGFPEAFMFIAFLNGISAVLLLLVTNGK